PLRVAGTGLTRDGCRDRPGRRCVQRQCFRSVDARYRRHSTGAHATRRHSQEQTMKHCIGAHTIDNGGLDMAVRRAAKTGMCAMQLFTAIPKFYGDKSTIRGERVERFRAAIAETGFDPKRIVAHGAYVLNVATPDTAKWV